MNCIWEDSNIVCDEAEASPISFNTTCASANMVNSPFRNKGEVKEGDKESLFDEINLELIKIKRKTLNCSKANVDKDLVFQAKKCLIRGTSSCSANSCGSGISEGSGVTNSKLSEDIKYLLGELVRSKKAKNSSGSSRAEARLVTMNDISPQ